MKEPIMNVTFVCRDFFFFTFVTNHLAFNSSELSQQTLSDHEHSEEDT